MRFAALTARARRSGAAALLVLVAAATACSGGGAAVPTAAVGPDGRPAPAPRPESIDDSSPEAAVRSFVAAEAAEAHDLSFGLLTAAERDELGSVEDWRDAHASQWPVAGGEVGEARADGDTATVSARMRYHSVLEESLGLVPARGRAEWKAVKEGDRWRVAFADRRVEPEVPSDDDADDRVAEWARARQACEPGPQYDGGLVGFPALADRLCRAEGDIAVGAAAELDSTEGDRFVAAFGPQALTWARVVPLTSPADVLRAVVAPIGDRWTVVGVLDPARAG